MYPNLAKCGWPLALVFALGCSKPSVKAPDGPVFDGRTVPQWAALLATGNRDDIDEARVVLEGCRSEAKNQIPNLIAIIDQLPFGDEIWRCEAAAMVLGSLGNEAKTALPKLMALFKSDSADLRLEAASAVIRIDPSQDANAIKVILQEYESKDEIKRVQASKHLFQLGALAKGAVPKFTAQLGSPDAMTRRQAIVHLRAIGPSASGAVSELVRLIQNEDRLMEDVLQALAAIGPTAKEAVPALIMISRLGDSEIAMDARAAIAQIDSTQKFETIEELLRITKGRDARLKRVAMAHLTRIDAANPKVISSMIALLDDDRLSIDASSLLIGSGKAAIPGLLGVLKEKHLTARISAARTLGAIQSSPTEVIPELIATLASDDIDVHLAMECAEALARFGQHGVPALIDALKHANSTVRGGAATALGKINPAPREAVAPLISLLKDDTNKGLAAEALGRMGAAAPEAIPGLRKLLKDGTYKFPAAAAMVFIDSLLGAETTPTLIEGLQSEFAGNRIASADALRRFGKGSPESLDALRNALQRESSENAKRSFQRALTRLSPSKE